MWQQRTCHCRVPHGQPPHPEHHQAKLRPSTVGGGSTLTGPVGTSEIIVTCVCHCLKSSMDFTSPSSGLLRSFQMAKLKLFPSKVDGCWQKQCEGKQKNCSREFLLRKNAAISCTVSASTYPLPAIARCLKHLKASRVCQDDFSAICRLALCLFYNMLISKHTLTEMLLLARIEGVVQMHHTFRFL